jgi:membrane protease YdiL (CAAX protease family)
LIIKEIPMKAARQAGTGLSTNKRLIIFLAATFLWTWAFYAPIALSGNSPYQMPWMVLLILGGAGPSIVGVLMAMWTFDKEERRDYWRRCFSCRRISLLWWLVIFLIFPILMGLSSLVEVALGGSLPGFEQFKSLMANPVMWPLAAFISFMSGPWSEEFGWRGYALDGMLKRYGTISGSVILGALWGVWHLPLFFMPATWHGKIGFGLDGFWMTIVYSIGLTLIMTWVYQSTDRSILSGMLLHFTSNFTSQLFDPASSRLEVLRAVLYLVVGLAVCIVMVRAGQKKETKAVPQMV